MEKYGRCPSLYSYLRLSTGFRLAALQLWRLTVSIAIAYATIPARAKIHQLISVLYA
jgi:hypothetical protein